MAALTNLNTAFKRFFQKHIPSQAKRLATGDMPLSALPLLAAAFDSPRRLVVLPDPLHAERFLADAQTLLKDIRLLPLSPADDAEALMTGERMAQVRAILKPSEDPALIITSIHALLQPIPDPCALEAASITLSKDEDVPFDTLSETLTTQGYERCERVTEPLFFAIRGGILDIWPAGAEVPVRIEFFGDSIEGLRTFDPATQCSTGRLHSLVIPPAPKATLKTSSLLEHLHGATTLLYDWIAIESYLSGVPLLSETQSNVEWFHQALEAIEGVQCFIGDPVHGKALPLPFAIFPSERIEAISAETDEQIPIDRQAAARRKLLADLHRRACAPHKETIYLCAETAAAQELLAHELPEETPLRLLCATLSEGFACPELNLSVVVQNDLYPRRRAWRAPTRRQSLVGQRLEFSLDIEPGDLVVHLNYGIGRFLGLREVVTDDQRIEVFTLEYAEGMIVRVPSTHAHLLSRYIGPRHNTQHIKLHKINGKKWAKDKESASKSIEDLAANLLETQARRRVMPGFAFKIDDPWIAEFEALFPYQETPDQARAIQEIKHDMAQPIAMDRLLCGDAGYGKTEVAMRAAFIAATNGKQVALLAPTTVLAEQHYETFCDRMAQFPIRIDVLSRFRTPTQRIKTREAAAKGEVDILIGTHALLSEDVPFADLGLLIIDEEQRFGVVHKERLRSLRSLVDILTMSATPIPRTLYLSLTGARDLSLLQTPPSERVAVETILHRDDDATLKTAIRRELARGGQVFYLYNRVLTIERVRARIKALLPEARVAIAHAQMSTPELAATMRKFERGDFDVLISTTIIGSGIDIPRANTILIDRADRFGLADLYQLRGRVGRSAVKGFAYLLLPTEGTLDSDARARLAALKRHSGLGAGYHIALRDLEIRGSGNLLGAAQSGHIAAIGFGLYCQLLRRTIARLKGEVPPTLIDTEIQFDCFNTSPNAKGHDVVAIPYDYIDEDAQRMNIFRRIAEAGSVNEIKALTTELRDRFGPLPSPAKHTLKIATLRILASEKHIARIYINDDKLTFYSKPHYAPIRGFANLPIPSRSPEKLLSQIEKLIHAL